MKRPLSYKVIWAGVTHSAEWKPNGKDKVAIFNTEPGTWSVLESRVPSNVHMGYMEEV